MDDSVDSLWGRIADERSRKIYVMKVTREIRGFNLAWSVIRPSPVYAILHRKHLVDDGDCYLCSLATVKIRNCGLALDPSLR